MAMTVLVVALAIPGGAEEVVGGGQIGVNTRFATQVSNRVSDVVDHSFPFLTRRVRDLVAGGHPEAAIRFQERLYTGLSRSAGKDHPRSLRALGDLARLWVAAGRLREGRVVFERLAQNLDRVLGPHHLETALARLGHAQVILHWPERAAEALDLIGMVEPVLNQFLWPDHPQRIMLPRLRARALVALGRNEEAERFLSEALQQGRSLFGPDDSRIVPILAERGAIRIRMARYRDAVTDLEQARSILGRGGALLSFAEHFQVLERLAEGYLARDDLEQALEILEEKVALLESGPGIGEDLRAKSLTDLGMVELGQGRLARAEVHLRQALALVDVFKERDHPQRAFILTHLGDVYWRQGKKKDAVRSFAAAEAAAASFFARDAVGHANWLASMAIILHQDGIFEPAKGMFSRSLHLLEGALGREDPAVVRVRRSLAFLSSREEEKGPRNSLRTQAAPGGKEKFDFIFEEKGGVLHGFQDGAGVVDPFSMDGNYSVIEMIERKRDPRESRNPFFFQ
ncbi:MAG: tetratricopeptide repeat protein [Magnetococcales bacterium]|nr:tetratricopeptide repeat protein [Magnetococcales bacterium]